MEYALIVIYIAFAAVLDSGPPLFRFASISYVRATAGQFNSLSLGDLIRLANDKEDRTGTIAAFYEAKQRHFKFLLTAFAIIVLANIITVATAGSNAESFNYMHERYSYLAYLTGFIMGIISVLVYRLRKIPSEYFDAMLVYSALKQEK